MMPSSIALLELGTRFSFNRTPHFCFAFVVQLLAARHCDFNFDPSILQIDARCHQRHSLFYRLLIELFNLAPVQEQLSRSERLVGVAIAMRIRGNGGMK